MDNKVIPIQSASATDECCGQCQTCDNQSTATENSMSTENTKNASYKALLEQRAQLDQQIKEVRIKERNTAIEHCRTLIGEYEISAEELMGTATPKPAGKVAAKYRDPETGHTWSGRGKAPLWIQGKDRDQFLI